MDGRVGACVHARTEVARRSGRWALALAGIVLVALVGLAPPASAHAEFVRSSPAPYDIWSYAPSPVYLTVSEAVEPGSPSLVVTDAKGLLVSGTTVLSTTDPTSFSVALSNMHPCLYTVIWTAISADDGHFTTGYFYFIVENPDGSLPAGFPTAPPPGFGASATGQPIPPEEGALHAALFISFAVVFGGLLTVLLIWRPAFLAAEPDERAAASGGFLAVLRMAWFGALAFLATLLGLWVYALSGVTITGPGSLVSSPFLLSLAARVPLALGLIALTSYAQTRARTDVVSEDLRTDLQLGLLLGFLALGAESFTSHSAGIDAWWPVGPIADAMHLYAVCLWVGGLAALVRAWPWLRRAENPRLTWSLLRLFSLNALAAVVLLVFGGILLEVILVGSLYALLTQPYGWTVIAKSVLIVPMVWLGWRNRKRVAKGSEPADTEPARRERISRNVTVELTIGVAILVAAALLTSMYPPATPPQVQYLSETTTGQGLFALFQVFPVPSAPGPYLATVQLWLAANGSPYVGMYNATATLTFVREGGGGNVTETLLGPHGPNHWYVQTDAMSQAGTYDVEARFARPDGFVASFPFQVTVYTPFYVPFATAGPP